MAGVKLLIALVIISVSLGGKWVGAQVHHVVGGDRGWDLSSDVVSWSSGRTYRVGDKIWFAYSAAQESIAEVSSIEEFQSCDISKPIRMFTDGLDTVPLDGEGIRYFASSKLESCKDGLKLHVEVLGQPKSGKKTTSEGSASAVAAGPTTPSASTRLSGIYSALLVGLLLCCYMGL